MRTIYRAARNLLATIGLLFAVVTFTPVLRPWIDWLAGDWTDPKGQTLIVLAAESLGNVMVGPGSYLRSVYAVNAWREGGFRTIIVSGTPASGPMRDFIVANGVPAASVKVELESTSTRTNAIFASRAMPSEPGEVVLLTSDFHMFRAYRAFRKAGLNVRPRPIPDAGKRMSRLDLRWGVFLDLVVETAKIVGYRLRGWI